MFNFFILFFLFFPLIFSKENLKDSILVKAIKSHGKKSDYILNYQTLGKVQIDHSQSLSLFELLESDSSLYGLQQGGRGSQSSLFIRGHKSENTLILIDGVELNDPSSPGRGANYSDILLGGFENVDILKSSQGVLHGSEGIGGVILIETLEKKENNFESTLTLNSQLGLFNKMRKKFVKDKLWGTFGYSILREKGISSARVDNGEKDEEALGNIYLALKGEVNSSLSWKYSLRSFFLKKDLDKFGGPFGDDPNDYEKSQKYISSFGGEYLSESALLKTSLLSTLYYSLRDTFELNDTTNEMTKRYRYIGLRSKNYIQQNYLLSEKIEMSWGGDYAFEKNFKMESLSALGVYLISDFKIKKNFNLNLGTRYNLSEKFQDSLNFNLGGALEFLPGFFYKLSWQTGNKNPSLFQLTDEKYGNRKIGPERSSSVESSFTFELEKFKIETNFFFTKVLESIEYDYSKSLYYNSSSYDIWGVECNLKKDFSENFSFNFSSTFLKVPQRLLRRPTLHLKVLMSYFVNENWQLNFDTHYVSSRNDVDPQTFKVISNSQYFFSNFYTLYKIKKRWSLTFKIENVFDVNYQTIMGYQNSPRVFYTGLNYQF